MKRKWMILFLLLGAVSVAVPACTKDLTWPDEDTQASTDNNDDDDDDDEDDSSADDSGSDGGSTYTPTGAGSTTVSIVFASAGATVDGGNDQTTITIKDNDVTITYSGEEEMSYELSGTASDGFFKLYSSYKQNLYLENLDLTNPAGAAINVQSHKKVTVTLSGDNKLADGSSYSDAVSSEDMKAAFFSEGQLIFKGDGSLTVTAKGKSGIVSDDYFKLNGPTLKVSSTAANGVKGADSLVVLSGSLDVTTSAATKKALSSDGLVRIAGGTTTLTVSGGTAYDSEDSEYKGSAGIKADGDFKMQGGSLTIKNTGQGGKGINGDGAGYFTGGTVEINVSGSNYGSSGNQGGPWGGGGSSSSSVAAKGIKFDGALTFSGSKVLVNASSHEGIESKSTITVTGGQVYSYSKSDDGINAAGDFTISGGQVCGYSAGNDGLDANGNLYIKGGIVYAIGSSNGEMGVDANSEGGKKLYVSGGTLVALSGLESGASLTQSCYSTSSWNKGTWYGMYDGSNNLIFAFKTPSSAGSPLVVSYSSKPTLKSGITVSDGTSIFSGMGNIGGTTSGGSSVTLSSYSGGSGGGRPW